MARVLILSSYVAASRVGGGAQALALARLGIEPILVPTVLFGRHPGHGPPGGGVVAADIFAGMIEGVAAQGLFGHFDAVITGHFSTPAQVAVAADTLGRVKAASTAARLIVDPVMGDEGGGLYVKEAVAEAVASRLVARADIVAPNAWELARLAGRPVADVRGALAAARALGKPVMVSSIRSGGRTGALFARADASWLAAHAEAAAAPKGTGDLLTALFAAALIERYPPPQALEMAVGGVAEAVAGSGGQDELAFRSLPTALAASPRVSLEPVDG